jgi:DNA-binding XRE family transcriptional regulator
MTYKIELMTQKTSRMSSKQIALSNENQWANLIEQLVDIRIQKGLTQQDVADLLGVTQPAVAQLELITSNPTINRIKLYALALGVELKLGVKR